MFMEENQEQKLVVPNSDVPAKIVADKPSGKDEEEFATIDYVKEIFLQGVEAEKINKKKLRCLQIIMVCVIIIMLAAVSSVFLAGPYVKSLVGDFHTITMKIQEADIKSISGQAITTLTEAQAALKTVTDAAANLQKLDMTTLNAAIVELTKTVEKFGKMDISSLNKSIETLAKVAESLGNIKILGKPLLG